jgi:hypothetical protein
LQFLQLRRKTVNILDFDLFMLCPALTEAIIKGKTKPHVHFLFNRNLFNLQH